jgi:TRAP-type C4-dicarboxylate transport system substrate-binding protein
MMISRRHFSAAGLALLGTSAITSPAAAATSIDLSTVLPEGSFHTENAQRYAAEVAKATRGQVRIVVHSGGALGFKGPDHLRAVGDGLVGMADIHVAQQAGDEPIFAAETIPFLVGNLEELRALHKQLRPMFEKAVARHNQKILYIVPWPAQYFFLKTRSDTLAGLHNVKVRVSDKNIQDMCAAIGMAPVLIPWVETIPALASGTISGVLTSSVSAVDGRLWEFVKYIYPTNHTWISQMVNINLDVWNRLSPAQREAMEQVATRLEPQFWAGTTKVDKDSKSYLERMGMGVVPIPGTMQRELRKRTANLLEAFEKRVPEARQPLSAYLSGVGRA